MQGTDEQEEHTERVRAVALTAWAIVGCCAVFLLAVRAIMHVWPAVALLLTGVILGFICSPVTNLLEKHGVPRSLAALIALLVLVVAIIALLVLLGRPFLRQTIALLQHAPAYLMQVQDFVNGFWAEHSSVNNQEVEALSSGLLSTVSQAVTEYASDAATDLSQGIIENVTSLGDDFVTFFLGLVLAFWFAKDYPRIARELAMISGPAHETDTMMMLAVLSRSMGGYMRGIVTTSTVGGLLSFLGFTLIGHPYAGLMGIVVGVFHFVPVIGPWVAAAFAAGLALFVSPTLAIESLVVSVIAQNVTDNLVSPLVMQSAVKVHPVLSLIGLIIGDSLGGVLGMALAIPLTAAIRSVFIYYFELRSGRQIVSPDGALFRSTPHEDEDGNIIPSADALDDARFFESTLLVTPHDMHVGTARPAGRRQGHSGRSDEQSAKSAQDEPSANE